MTLTPRDLQAIAQIVDQKLKNELGPIKNDILDLKTTLKKELKPIKKDIKHIKSTQDLIIGQFDQRLNHLEKHTTHPPKLTPFLAT